MSSDRSRALSGTPLRLSPGPPSPGGDGPSRSRSALRDDGQGPARVLVVEDNVDAALTLVDLLRIWGHVVECVHDGPAAVELAARYRPEVVLLDIGLPGMDGYEVARRLRGAPETRDALLVAVTGYGQESDRARSREAGFDHHLVKPVDLAGLRRLIEAREERLAGRFPGPA